MSTAEYFDGGFSHGAKSLEELDVDGLARVLRLAMDNRDRAQGWVDVVLDKIIGDCLPNGLEIKPPVDPTIEQAV